jgi:hypothetical protein
MDPPREIVDPENNLTARQRANRAYYLRNAEYKRERARYYYWLDAERQRFLRRERYWISKLENAGGEL